jgi:FtsH-binding integral membrane protein
MMTETIVANSTEIEKADFYRKTYMHVALSVLAFIGVETLLLKIVPGELIFKMISGKFVWLFIIGIFWLASMLANKWSLSQSRSTQYLGLGFYILLEAVIFLPMIYFAVATAGGPVIFQAAMLTIAMFAGLSVVAFTSKRDFSFLKNIIIIGGFISLGLIVAGSVFNSFGLGLWFSVGMVVLASASILYETSKLKDTYTTGQYVGAALQLFASVMLLFWYILRILMSRRS